MKNYITKNGWKKLSHELYQLVHHDRKQVVETVSWAAKNGDRSENGDYLYGKRRLREIDRRIRFLTKQLENAEVIDSNQREATDQVFFGATVSIKRANNQLQTLCIVGVDEINPSKGYISWTSPLARALLKAKKGDSVNFEGPQGHELIEIIAVGYKELADWLSIAII